MAGTDGWIAPDCCVTSATVCPKTSGRVTRSSISRSIRIPTTEKQQKLRFGAPRRAKKRKKLQIPWAESSEIDENCEFRGRNHQKSAKTANSVDGIIRNRRKLQIPWTESSKNDENCEFRGQNHQKTEKTGFPHPGENQNHPFSAFPHPYNFLLTNYLVEK